MSLADTVRSRVLADPIAAYARALDRSTSDFKVSRNEAKTLCPLHSDTNPSLRVNIEKGVWFCDPCGKGGDLFQLVATYYGLTEFPLVAKKLATLLGINSEADSLDTISATYDYCDEKGELLYQKVRFDPKGFKARRPDGMGGWTWNLEGVRRVLFRLRELLAADIAVPVFIVEGEKDVVRLVYRGFIATTSPFGHSKTPTKKEWLPEWNEIFRNRKIIIIPDNDEVGIEFAWYVAEQLLPVAAEVRIVELPDLPPSGDVSDFFEKGGTRERLIELVDATPAVTALAIEFRKSQSSARKPRAAAGAPVTAAKKSQADLLVELALQNTELFHDDDTPYATIDAGDHKETWPIQSRRFRLHILGLYYKTHGKVPDVNAVRGAINTLSGKAFFDGAEVRVHVRVAEQQDAICLDLADELWRAVEITPAGWRVVSDPPVKFRRARGMLALREPKHGSSINDLRPFLNVADEDDFTLTVAWLLAALRGCGPYPILVIHGEQGCGKSTRERVCRELVDPNRAPLRRRPRDEQDLMIAANNGHIIALDNLSYLQTWLSDALCVLATGGGLGKRELYSDAEEVILNAVRPIMLNGIEELATRGDLLDRSIISYLPVIAEEERQEERKFRAAFEAAQPRILGALLDAISMALRRRDEVQLDHLPRMADFAAWVAAAEPALGWKEGRFLEAYERNRDDASALAIQASAVAGEVQKLRLPWEGTAEELMVKLNESAAKETKQARSWPTDARRLSGALRRITPNLRELGILIEFLPRQNVRRPIRISMVAPGDGKSASPTSPPSRTPAGDAGNGEIPTPGGEDWGEA